VCLPMQRACRANEIEATFGTWVWFIWFVCFQLVILYFLFGVLEVYVSVNDTWQSGLVMDNYTGIITLVCEPLVKEPATISDLLSGADGAIQNGK